MTLVKNMVIALQVTITIFLVWIIIGQYNIKESLDARMTRSEQVIEFLLYTGDESIIESVEENFNRTVAVQMYINSLVELSKTANRE